MALRSSQFVSSYASCSKTSSYECLILSYAASLIACKISIILLTNLLVSPSVTRHCTRSCPARWMPRSRSVERDAPPSGPCHYPTEVVPCRTNTRSQRWFDTDSSATIQPRECSRRPDVRTPMESNGTRHQDRLDAHPTCTCAHVCAA